MTTNIEKNVKNLELKDESLDEEVETDNKVEINKPEKDKLKNSNNIKMFLVLSYWFYRNNFVYNYIKNKESVI